MASKTISSVEDFEHVLGELSQMDNPPAFVALAHRPDGSIAKAPRSVKLEAIDASKKHQLVHFNNTYLYEWDGEKYAVLSTDARKDFPVVRKAVDGEKPSNSQVAQRALEVQKEREVIVEIGTFNQTLRDFQKNRDFTPAACEQLEYQFTELLNTISSIMERQ